MSNESEDDTDAEKETLLCESLTQADEEQASRDLYVCKSAHIYRKPPSRYGYKDVDKLFAGISLTYEEAVVSEQRNQWRRAMDREFKQLEENMWCLVERLDDKEVIDMKWIFRIKPDGTYKARLVARGFQQTSEADDIYSPVARLGTLKLLLSYCCQFNLNIDQMDIEVAFLNGKLNSEVYTEQPVGYEKGRNKVCKLNKALYRLRESPCRWYECFNDYIITLGFERNNYD